MTNLTREQDAEMLQNRFGQRITARLSAGSTELPHDLSERLRIARQQAVAMRKPEFLPQRKLVSATGVFVQGNSLSRGDEGLNLWSRLASAFPVVALVVGLVAIHVIQNDYRAQEVAEVDTALLTDALPPAAYTDPGFLQFLKSAAQRPRSD